MQKNTKEHDGIEGNILHNTLLEEKNSELFKFM